MKLTLKILLIALFFNVTIFCVSAAIAPIHFKDGCLKSGGTWSNINCDCPSGKISTEYKCWEMSPRQACKELSGIVTTIFELNEGFVGPQVGIMCYPDSESMESDRNFAKNSDWDTNDILTKEAYSIARGITYLKEDVITKKKEVTVNNKDVQNDANKVEEKIPKENSQVESQNSTVEEVPLEAKAKESTSSTNVIDYGNVVATFVHSIENVSDEKSVVNEQLKDVAQQLDESKEIVTTGIEIVKKRGAVKTFLIGADYKNLGKLGNEMVKVKKQIEQLKRLIEKIESEENKTELLLHLQTLEQEQTKVQSFVYENENKFSLFGWLVRLF